MHNTRNANIAQHSEIIRIATRKIVVISRQMSPDYPQTDAKYRHCGGTGIPNQPEHPQTDAKQPHNERTGILNRPDYPQTDAKRPNCEGLGIPNLPKYPQTDANQPNCEGLGILNNPGYPQTDANWRSGAWDTTRGKESRAQQTNGTPTKRHSRPTAVRQQPGKSTAAQQKTRQQHKSGANITLTPLSQCNHKPNRPMQQVEFSRSPNQASHLVGSMTSLPPM